MKNCCRANYALILLALILTYATPCIAQKEETSTLKELDSKFRKHLRKICHTRFFDNSG